MKRLHREVLPLLICSLSLVGCQQTEYESESMVLTNPIIKKNYICDNGLSIDALYDNHDPARSKLTLKISGMQYFLIQNTSVPDIRYVTHQGLTAQHGLIWLIKDQAIIASNFIVSDQDDPDTKVLFTCQSRT